MPEKQAQSKPITFVLNDETVVNCYGFRIPNKALNLKRFKANPVMLAQHEDGIFTVVGRWENIRTEGAELLADAVFDLDDKFARKVAGKVERGFLKGASLGFVPDGFTQAIDGIPDLISGEVMEASVCPIPGNAGALKLYASSGEVMNLAAIKLSLSNTNSSFSKTDTPQTNMKGLVLSIPALALLGFQKVPAEGEESQLSAAIEKLANDNKMTTAENVTLKAKNEELEKQLKETQKAVSKGMLDRAVLSGQILEIERPHYEALALSNMELCITTLAKLPAKQNLSDRVDNPTGNATDPKTMEEFQKLSLDQQLAFKNNNAAGYKKIVEG